MKKHNGWNKGSVRRQGLKPGTHTRGGGVVQRGTVLATSRPKTR